MSTPSSKAASTPGPNPPTGDPEDASQPGCPPEEERPFVLERAELTALLDCASELVTETDPDKLVHVILAKACSMTQSPDGSVYLLDPVRNGLYFAAAVGSKGPELLHGWGEQSSQRIPLDDSNAGEAFTTGKIVYGGHIRSAAKHFKEVDSQTGKTSSSIVSVPLGVGGRNIGVLQVLNKVDAAGQKAAYQTVDCELLTHLGRFAAIALNNARVRRRLTAQMGLYSTDPAEDLLARLDHPAERETMTVMFADLRGFTRLCQAQAEQPLQTQEILNDLLTMFADSVLTRQGIVNKFIGDAVFALFRRADAPQRAVRCAFDMLERFESLKRRWDGAYNQDLSFLDLGIGIATGPVALGSFGSASVRDFTAIGTLVNLASGFEAAARNGRRVLVDNATWTSISKIVRESEGPTQFQLGKPGQQVVNEYRHYHIKKLSPDRPIRVFISHNHQDREFVERVITAPLAKHRIQTWYSNADIIPGQQYVTAIEDGLLKCDWMLVVLTENTLKSDWVKAEVETAMRDSRFENRIVPILAGAGSASQIHVKLGLIQGIDLQGEADPGERLCEFLIKQAST